MSKLNKQRQRDGTKTLQHCPKASAANESSVYNLLLSLWIPCSICYFPYFYFFLFLFLLLPSSSSSLSSSTVWFMVRIQFQYKLIQFHAKNWEKNWMTTEREQCGWWNDKKKSLKLLSMNYNTWLLIIFSTFRIRFKRPKRMW